EAEPDKAWLVAGEDEYTYAEALDQVERAAGALRAGGVGRHDRVLVTSRNTPVYLFTWLATMEVGAVQAGVNPNSTSDELAGFVRQISPRLSITDDNVCDLFTGEPDTSGPADVEPDDVAVLIPTSGTTGRSKLVMQTHVAYVMAG